MRFSVIVPVYNEEYRLTETVPSMLHGLPLGVELVYVCNGCTDKSLSTIERLSCGRATIIELPNPGKGQAIRAAERCVSQFPRFYVDSDVVITGEDLVRLARFLSENDLDLVAPRLILELDGANKLSSMVHRIWLDLPHASGEAFHNTLGLSEMGRANWGEFPNVIADDTFIESKIPAGRKRIDHSVTARVRPARTLMAVLGVKIRWIKGQEELRRLNITPSRTEGQKRALFAMMARPSRFLPAFLYLALVAVARVLAILPYCGGHRWFRDSTSREPARLLGKDRS